MSNYYKPSLRLSLRLQHLAAALLIFALLYTLTNSYSCCPKRVHHLATSLDDSIAFIPTMIVPYSWSLILFVASFFVVRTAKQLSLLTARLITATVLACTVFYLYPAQFFFIRPLTTDWTAFGYLFLSLTDKPYNQLPSLHVSYVLLLGICLWDISQGRATRQVIIYWLLLTLIFSLIIVLTVFTYQ